MKVERRDGSQERRILTAMVTDKVVLGRIAGLWKPGLFQSPHANLVAGWAVSHWERYEEAPGMDIVPLYEAWAAKNADDASQRLVEVFLSDLSDSYQNQPPINADHILDLAGEHFNKVRLVKLRDKLEGHLLAGDVKEAEDAVQLASHKVELGVGAGEDPFTDKAAITDTFSENLEPIVEYPGALGQFFQDFLARDSLVAFLGPEKSGKTFWLIDIAYRAMCQRRRVAFFEVGDMTARQVKRRLYSRVAQHPFRSPNNRWPLEVAYPETITRGKGDEMAKVISKKLVFNEPLSRKIVWQACQGLMEKLHSSDSFFRLSFHPNSTVNVQGIRSLLATWELHGWRPDVIVIDYADILAAPAGKMEVRDQINTTWKQLRSLSQELHCLVVTATQANARSYSQVAPLTRGSFSEDKRKLAHATALFGINVLPEEKEQGICRLNPVVVREGDFSTYRCVHVAQCLALSNPAVRSCF